MKKKQQRVKPQNKSGLRYIKYQRVKPMK